MTFSQKANPNSRPPMLPRSVYYELKSHQEQLRERYDRKKKAVRARPGAEEGPAHEELVCPSCREPFLFGSTCPTCNVFLVGESLLSEDVDADNAEFAQIAQQRTLKMAVATLALAIVSLVFDPFMVFSLAALLGLVIVPHGLLTLAKPVRKQLATPWVVGNAAAALAAATISIAGWMLA